MNNVGLPPLPPRGAVGLEVCNVIQLYMAVWNDLTPEEIRVVSAHIAICADCAYEQRIFNRMTRKVADLDASSPSPRVDQAVMMAIAARSKSTSKGAVRSVNKGAAQSERPVALVTPIKKHPRKPRNLALRFGGLAAAAAVMFVGLFAASHYIMPGGPSHSVVVSSQATKKPVSSLQAFALPTDLSWNGLVLYHTQNMMSTAGQPFTEESYQDLASGRMNVETIINKKLDVVTVGDAHESLAMDMMHHVAQWDASGWKIDGSMFDLNKLRQQLKDGQVVYEGKATFQGQSVYRIRYPDNEVLLLGMDYMPINVLEPGNGAHTTEPMYAKLQLLPSTKVPKSMWSMNVPHDFKLGKLPTKPIEATS